MKTYCQNGILEEVPYIINDELEFKIQAFNNNCTNNYSYSGDSINYHLDNELVLFHNTIRALFFDDEEEYNKEIQRIPAYISSVGFESDYPINTNEYMEMVKKSKNAGVPNLYKHLYLQDCYFLIGTIQNLLCSMEYVFVRYYITLTELENNCAEARGLVDVNETRYYICETSRNAAALIETYFTKAYSILDMLCKLCFEIENKKINFEHYEKIQSDQLLWGKKKNLSINKKKDTLFEECDLVKKIESLRNEVVHNGTWELNPKIYVRYENGIVQERYMLFPDISQGRLASANGRKHFFGDEIKINYALPNIHGEFKRRLLNTIMFLNGREIKSI